MPITKSLTAKQLATAARWAATAAELRKAQHRLADHRMQRTVQAPLIPLAEVAAQPSLFDLAMA